MELIVNGKTHVVDVNPDRPLLYVLRDDLGLKGSKYGCGEGQCGACTVLVDGTAVRSCTTAAEHAAGKQITTIEGLAQEERLHRLQQAFLDADALQCGYCTPGMVMSAAALLKEKPDPSREDIVAYMDSNVCRCGTYPRIITAIRRAAEMAKEG